MTASAESTDDTLAGAGVPLIVNGTPQRVHCARDVPLLWVLRDVLKLTGTKYGCGVGVCGVCMVLVDDKPDRACTLPLGEVENRAVTTIEGLAAHRGHPLLRAWTEEQVPQCGYCQPAQLVNAYALLDREAAPSGDEIESAMDAVFCRCGTYPRIRRALGRMLRETPSSAGPWATLAPCLAPDGGVALNEWIGIRSDNTVVVTVNHSEMGQGVLTALAMLVAEELDVDLAQVQARFAPAAKRYFNPRLGAQVTGGSTAIRAHWEPLRRAGAAARERLVRAAAKKWKARQRDCRTERGTVVHLPSGRRARYSELVAKAKAEAAPSRVALKSPGAFRLIGRPLPRREIPEMIAGQIKYGIDTAIPGMRVALVRRPPQIGASVLDFDASRALQIPGVHDVVQIERGIAVVAEDFWTAWKGREALEVRWRPGPRPDLSTAMIYRELEAALEQRGVVIRSKGAAQRALEEGDRIVEARYLTPQLAHCTLEPMNCIADVRDDGCDVWTGTQSQTDTQSVAAKITGLARRKINVHTTFLGGGFGRRLETDFVAEAVELSKRIGAPVQVVWTRADDLAHDYFRPAHAVKLTAALDRRGEPTAWLQRITGPSIALKGNDVAYAIPHYREEHVELEAPLPPGAWRGVGATQNAFPAECFIDELAHHAERDPLAFRMQLLKHMPRHAAVLEKAAQEAGWGKRASTGRGLGLAVYRSFGSWVAQVAEVSVGEDRQIRVHRITCVIDCGTAINPDTIRAQVEGSIVLGLSAALIEEVALEQGSVKQTSLADYPILTYSQTPDIDVHIVDSSETPGGVGEPAVPPVAPALANAVFAATGQRLRRLPLKLACTAMMAIALVQPTHVKAQEAGPSIEAGRQASMELGRELREELTRAMASGGPIAAVDVCHARAPELAARISERLSRQAGIEVRVSRTSLRTRNPANEPDEAMREVLQEFERRHAGGTSIEELEYFAPIISGEIEAEGYRYMKAIPTEAGCLVCHGGEIAPSVRAIIDERYPHDRARGFSAGDIRGAFVVEWRDASH